jgi:hypothetical protein
LRCGSDRGEGPPTPLGVPWWVAELPAARAIIVLDWIAALRSIGDMLVGRTVMWAVGLALGAMAASSGLPGLLGCSSSHYPAKPPAPSVEPAPTTLRVLRIYVHQMATPAENAQDEWDYHHTPGYTTDLRDAFRLALTRAGYTTVVSRHAPSDLTALVEATWPSDRAGVATLTLTSGPEVVDQLSVEIPVLGTTPYMVHLEDHAAVSLVRLLNRSKAVADMARGPRQAQPLQVASPGPPPEDSARSGETEPKPLLPW